MHLFPKITTILWFVDKVTRGKEKKGGIKREKKENKSNLKAHEFCVEGFKGVHTCTSKGHVE